MPLGTNHVGLTELTAASRTRSNSAFVPELWTDEIIAAYKANLVMEALVSTMSFAGQKGDTIHVPRPVRGEASAKAAETQVTLISNQELRSQYIIDQHWEYSRLIEDIAATQAMDSARQFYTDDAGFALGKRVDNFLHTQGSAFAGADASPTVAGTAYSKAVIGTPTSSALVVWDPTASTNAGNAATITDEGIRLMVQQLDDNDVPSMGRVLVVPPVEKRRFLGIDRHVLFDNVGEGGASNAMRNGYVGDIYGTPVYVSTNCPTVAATDTTVDQRAALYFHKGSLLLASQMAPRTQTQYKQEWLSDLFTADILFGGGVLRPESGIAVVIPE